jgi:hypothetical protein
MLPPITMKFLLYRRTVLTNDDLVLFWEVILWHLQIQRRRSFSYAARDIVVGTVAGTEPAAEVSGFADWDASEVSADA